MIYVVLFYTVSQKGHKFGAFYSSKLRGQILIGFDVPSFSVANSKEGAVGRPPHICLGIFFSLSRLFPHKTRKPIVHYVHLQ